jgi:DNA-binding LytR/AlgR family response regulator
MEKIKCLIADDEALALDVLESYIEKIDKLQLAGKCKNGLEVFNALKKGNIDLLFLDIQMPELTGIELLRAKNSAVPVIVTTASREHALEGYELNVLDYLLKPISLERFLKSIDKFEATKKAEIEILSKDTLSLSKEKDFIFVKSEKKMVKVFLSDIHYLEALKDYVRIKVNEKEIVTYETMSHFEKVLPSHQFVRTHRSYIISLAKLNSFSANALEVQGKEIPIGKIYKLTVLEKINKTT